MIDYDKLIRKVTRGVELRLAGEQTEATYQLYRDVAPILAGRPVEVDFCQPAGGVCGWMISTRNSVILQIDPLTQEDETFYIFLHECAHARFDAGDYQPGLPAGKITPQDIQEATAVIAPSKPKENRADKQSAEWYAWAVKRSNDKSVTGLLRALLQWSEN